MKPTTPVQESRLALISMTVRIVLSATADVRRRLAYPNPLTVIKTHLYEDTVPRCHRNSYR